MFLWQVHPRHLHSKHRGRCFFFLALLSMFEKERSALHFKRRMQSRKERARRRIKMKTPEEIVDSIVNVNELTSVKKIVVLEGEHDAGKTSTLKDVVRQVYELYPTAWMGQRKYVAEKFDIKTLSENVQSRDYTAVFKINGIVVVIRTGGDNPSVIASTFSIAAKYKAEIVVMALKVGNNKSRAQIAFEKIMQSVKVEVVTKNIRGRVLRKYSEETEVAKSIVSVIVENVEKKGG